MGSLQCFSIEKKHEVGIYFKYLKYFFIILFSLWVIKKYVCQQDKFSHNQDVKIQFVKKVRMNCKINYLFN